MGYDFSHNTRATRTAHALFILGIAVMVGSIFAPMYQIGEIAGGFSDESIVKYLWSDSFGKGRPFVATIVLSQVVSIIASSLLVYRISSAWLIVTALRALQLGLLWVDLCLYVVPRGNGWGLWLYGAGSTALYLSTFLPRIIVAQPTGGFEVLVAPPSGNASQADS
jgi:hypothetical protein